MFCTIFQYSTKVSTKSILPEQTKHPTLNDTERENIIKYAVPVNTKKFGSTAQNIIDFKNDEIALVASQEATISAAVDEVKKGNKELVQWQVTPTNDLSKLLNHYLMLSKIRLTSKTRKLGEISLPAKHSIIMTHSHVFFFILALVVITSMVGYAMAPAPFMPTTFLLCSLGTGLCSAAANAINQYHEVPFDAQMSRTKNRVLVRGLLTPLHSINFAIASASVGIGLLYFGVNGYTAALGAANLILYTSIYTPMKRFSILNTWVGSIGRHFLFAFR